MKTLRLILFPYSKDKYIEDADSLIKMLSVGVVISLTLFLTVGVSLTEHKSEYCNPNLEYCN